MQKFLLIGLGGSGGKTIRYLWREIRRRLKEASWEGDVPSAFRFIHIDCPEHPDIIEGDVPAQMQGADHTYLGLGTVPRTYKAYDESLIRKPGNLKALTGWRPDPDDDIPPPYLGAGQRRSVGRMVGLSEFDDIGAVLEQAVKSLGAQDVTSELQRLADRLGTSLQVGGAGTPITTIVIGSLGGGSGSGIINDVVELLRSLPEGQTTNLGQRILTLLYAPDVFSHLAAEDRMGIEPNTLAALCELVAGFEHEGGIDDFEAALLQHGKGMVPLEGRRAAKTNLIIGTRNASISYSTSHEVYQAIAKALAQYVVDTDVRSRSEKYTVNQMGKTVTSEFRITNLAGERSCSSLGYANVSLGSSLFAEYAQERLAKLAMERLLRGHQRWADVTAPKRDEVLIKEVIERETPGFIERCGLYEFSTTHNEVLDALRDVDEVKGQIDRQIGSAQRDLESRSDEQSPRNWLSSLTAAFDEIDGRVMKDLQAVRLQRAGEWSGEIQTQVLKEVANALSQFGFPVTKELVEQLVRQLDAAADELERDASKLEQESEDALSKIASAFSALRGLITPQHQQFSIAARDRAERLFKHSEAELYRFTVTVLREMIDDFFGDLQRVLASGESRLGKIAAEQSDLVEQWSSEAVPPHLRPAPNEILLESHEDFPRVFDRLVGIQFDDGVDGALREVVTGAWDRIHGTSGENQQTLVEVVQTWQPSNLGTRRAQFKLELDPLALLDRAEDWVQNRKEGEVTKFAKGSLNEWLGKDQPEAASRASRFADAFELALASSAPLVSIAPFAYEQVHGSEAPKPRPVISSIPIGKDHDAYQRIADALTELELSPGDVDKLFQPTISRSAVEISSFLPSSVHPTVFGSLMSPILADWQSRKTPQDRSQFWYCRRSRQLRSFVPMSPPRQRAFIRGWLTANLLGHIDPLTGPWSDGPLSVWTPTGRRSFPENLLGREVRQHGAVLPALLESLPLALLTLANGSTGEFEAYVRILDLGTAADDVDGTGQVYGEANEELVRWVLDGETTAPRPTFEAAPQPREALAGLATGAPKERAEALLAAIDDYLQGQQSVAEQEISPETSLTLGRGWEVSRMAIQAADQLHNAIGAINVEDLQATAWG
ncbi:MAG TPA: tubulin-like doman-containing protein [Solirubrobacterales bacterium]|nr:tubulin-like doman-containing protein [Solirubrobacterales bacterium]